MTAPPCVIEAAEFDPRLPELPNTDGVFVIWAGGQPAYLAKTGMLRRRLQRVLRPTEIPGRGLNLRGVATRVEYWITGSRFESALLHFHLARLQHPDSYRKLVKLRLPAYVRLTLANEFPRSYVTNRLSASQSLHYGPFRSRAAAEQFESEMLDHFQIRRCQEDLAPHPAHPGCIYGEMNRCLRPCQEVVHAEEYRSEANRVAEFLTHNGRSMLQTIQAARDRLSEEMNFEEAARQHRRMERVNQLLALGGELVCDINRLYGVAIQPAAEPGAVKLWFVCQGWWQTPVDFPLTSSESLDRRLRELIAGLEPVHGSRLEREEHLALLARWNYSSWRDGEWVQFESLAQLPYRKLVRAISRCQASVKAADVPSVGPVA